MENRERVHALEAEVRRLTIRSETLVAVLSVASVKAGITDEQMMRCLEATEREVANRLYPAGRN